MTALTENVEGQTEGVGTGSGGLVYRDVVEAYNLVYFTDIPDSLGSID